jgi:hypothetical protein
MDPLDERIAIRDIVIKAIDRMDHQELQHLWMTMVGLSGILAEAVKISSDTYRGIHGNGNV